MFQTLFPLHFTRRHTQRINAYQQALKILKIYVLIHSNDVTLCTVKVKYETVILEYLGKVINDNGRSIS